MSFVISFFMPSCISFVCSLFLSFGMYLGVFRSFPRSVVLSLCSLSRYFVRSFFMYFLGYFVWLISLFLYCLRSFVFCLGGTLFLYVYVCFWISFFLSLCMCFVRYVLVCMASFLSVSLSRFRYFCMWFVL